MTEAWVVNASPLILFARITRLDLIEQLAPTVLIPNAVIQEVRAGLPKDPTAAVALAWAEAYHVKDTALPASVEHWDLGPGESQVIAHSAGRPRWAVLDDQAARRCAAAHDVPVIGSLGMVMRAKNAGKVERARPLVEQLMSAGMFLNAEFVDRVLESVGE